MIEYGGVVLGVLVSDGVLLLSFSYGGQHGITVSFPPYLVFQSLKMLLNGRVVGKETVKINYDYGAHTN